jgi:segregation and condensation protein B
VEPVRAVEAVLFASSRPLRMSEIEAATQLAPDAIRRSLAKLKKEYDERGSAVELVKIGVRHALQLRKEYVGYGLPFAEKELPREVLRTAAYIAYNQPILQSELAKALGSEVYEHVRALRGAGLISASRRGQTLLLTTSKRFAEYFGIASSRKEDIKRWMESQAGQVPDRPQS